MIGYCFQIIDLGTQQLSFDGHGKLLRRLMLSFETPDGVKSKNYTFSRSINSSLYRDMRTWGCDITTALGRWAELVLEDEHIVAIHPAEPAWTPEHKLRRFDMDNPDLEVLAQLPPRVQEMIKKAPEWRA